MNIKKFVLKSLEEGMTVLEAWKAAQVKFYPLRIVGWNYVQKLARDYHKGEA